MALKGNHKGKGKDRAKLLTLVINRRLLFDRDRIKGFISKCIRGLIQIFNVCGIKDHGAWVCFYVIILHEPVMTHHFSQFQLIWPLCGSSCLPFLEWSAAFLRYMGQMFHKTCDQLNNVRLDNPRAFAVEVDGSDQPATSSGRVKPTSKHLSWYCSDDPRAKI